MKRSMSFLVLGIVLGFLIALPVWAFASNEHSPSGTRPSGQAVSSADDPAGMMAECSRHMGASGGGMMGMMGGTMSQEMAGQCRSMMQGQDMPAQCESMMGTKKAE